MGAKDCSIRSCFVEGEGLRGDSGCEEREGCFVLVEVLPYSMNRSQESGVSLMRLAFSLSSRSANRTMSSGLMDSFTGPRSGYKAGKDSSTRVFVVADYGKVHLSNTEVDRPSVVCVNTRFGQKLAQSSELAKRTKGDYPELSNGIFKNRGPTGISGMLQC